MKALILAAGQGTRLEPLTETMPKCMLPLAGKPLLEHILGAVKKAGIKEAIIVTGYRGEEIKNYFGNGKKFGVGIGYLTQEQRLGTAHAIGLAKFLEPFIAVNGDTLISYEPVKSVLSEFKKHSRCAAVIGLLKVENPGDYGVVVVNRGVVEKIAEKPKERISELANAGIYLFSPKIFGAIAKTEKSQRGEYEITSSIEILINAGEEIRGTEIQGLWSDVGTPWSYLDANQSLLKKTKSQVKGRIEDNVAVKGALHLGRGSVIKSGSYIEGPVYIGGNCVIGPAAYLRSFATIGSNCKIGSAVEIKNSIIMDNTHIPHLSYVGDSIVGRNCNFGAGSLVGNLRVDGKNVKMRLRGELRDSGRRKLGCVVGDNVKLGLNIMINAGRKIGSNSMLGPGVIVYEDVPASSFIIQKQAIEKRESNP